MFKRKVLVGKSEIKRLAVEQALETAGVKDWETMVVPTDSVVHAQPVGREVTHLGAHYRASRQLEKYVKDTGGGNVLCSVGIENGIVEEGGGWVDLAAISVMYPGVTEVVTTTGSVRLSKKAVELARIMGFEHNTVGKAMKYLYGCNHQDPHSYITGGKKSRQQFIAEALVNIFKRDLA